MQLRNRPLKDLGRGVFLIDGDKDGRDGDSKHVVWSITVVLGAEGDRSLRRTHRPTKPSVARRVFCSNFATYMQSGIALRSENSATH